MKNNLVITSYLLLMPSKNISDYAMDHGLEVP